MTNAVSRALVGVSTALVLASGLTACSRDSTQAQEPGATATSGTAAAMIDIRTGSMFVTVENKAGQPLVDVRVAIRPVGVMSPFTTSISRMESGEKRDFLFGNFGSRDGTPFSLRVARPRDVVVTARDMVGNTHEVTVPWK